MIGTISRNFAAQTAGLLVSFAERFFVVGVLLRSWGTDVYAEWALLLAFASILSIGELGLNIYYGNIWQQASASGDTEKFQRTVSVALFCSLAVACVLGLIGVVLLTAFNLRSFLPIDALTHAEALTVLCLLGVATLSRIGRGAVSQIYRGRRAFALGGMVDLVFPASALVLIVLAGLFGAGPVTVASIYLACDIIAGWCLISWDLSRRWPDLRFRPSIPTWTELTDIVHHVRWLSIQQGAPLAWLQAPVILLGYVGTAGPALVSFVILRTLVNFVRTICTMLSNGCGVEIANVHYAGRQEDVARQLAIVGGVLSALTAALAVGVIIFGEPFVALWTGQPDLFNATIAGWLLLSAIIAAPSVPLASYLMYANAPRPASIALLTQLIVGLSACWVLAGRFGVTGAAAGLAVGEAVAYGVLLPTLAMRFLQIGCRQYLLRCATTMTLTAVWCGAVGMALQSIIDLRSAIGLVTAAALWGAFAVAPVLVVVLPARAREQSSTLLRTQRPTTRSAVFSK